MNNLTEYVYRVDFDDSLRLRYMFQKNRLSSKIAEKLSGEISKLSLMCNSGRHKINKFLEISQGIIEKNEKIIIFTSFSTTSTELMNALIENKLDNCAILVNGTINQDKRKTLIDAFNHEPDKHILICTDAILYGHRFKNVNHLMNYDYKDVQIVEQRNGRVSRLGNNHNNTSIYYLVTNESIEVNIYDNLLIKRKMFLNL